MTTVALFGVNVGIWTRRTALRRIEELLAGGGTHRLFFVNAHTLNLAYADPEYCAVLNSADLVLNDGIGVALAARAFGARFPENLVGTDFLPALCEVARDRRCRVYLLGAWPSVAELAAARLQARFPGLRLVGTHHGHFDREAEPRVIDAIRRAAPDILLVALGNPLQEQWIARHQAELGVPLCAGVGAFFDLVSGRVLRAPDLVRRARMEWLFRLVVEPRRLWRRYLLGNPLFLWRLVRARLATAAAPTETPSWT